MRCSRVTCPGCSNSTSTTARSDGPSSVPTEVNDQVNAIVANPPASTPPPLLAGIAKGGRVGPERTAESGCPEAREVVAASHLIVQPEAGCLSFVPKLVSAESVWVELSLTNDQPGARTKDSAELAQRRGAVVDFSKHGNQEGCIEGGFLKRQGGCVALLRLAHVVETTGA